MMFNPRSSRLISTIILSCLIFLSPAIAQQEEKLVLVNDKFTPQVIIRANPTEAEKFAAEELSTYLGKITSKPIPVTSNDSPQTSVEIPQIILGNHPLNADLHPEKLEVEEASISVEPNRLRITGGWEPTVTNSKGTVIVRDRGTIYGVYELLDRLGVRWFRPETWGEHVPQKNIVTLPLGQDTFKPAYTYRSGFNTYRWKATKEQAAMANRWAFRNRHAAGGQPGSAYGVYVGHNLNNLLPRWKYAKEHPEYYALVNGERKGQQICMGNPVVQEEVAQALVQFVKDNPNQTIRSIEPYDSLDGFCECELCRAMDDPNLTTPAGEKRLDKASMSNRMAIFGNYVARRLREEGQHLSISWYAYATHFEAPTKVTAMEPNIYVGPTTIGAAYGDYSKLLHDPKAPGNVNFLKIVSGWSQYTNMFARDYWSGGCWYGPLPYLTFLTDRTRNYRKYNIQGIVNEVHPSWGAQTMAHYFAVRLQVNPDIDVDKELEYFCDSYFGPAGKPMLEYHRALEKASLEGPAYYFSGRFIDRLFLDDKLMDKLNGLIAESKTLIGDQQPYAKRFEGMEAGHEVARVRNLVERYKKQKNALAAISEWDALGKKITANTEGDIFNVALTSYTWKVMTEQAGIAALRKQLDTIKQNPGAAILQNLNDGWKFSTDPQKTGLQQGVVKPGLSDRTWHTVNATSTWQEQGHAYQGTAWYRKTLDLAKKEDGKRYALFFGGVDGDAVIYINGEKAGEHLLGEGYAGWDDDFMIDVTPQLKAGKNIVAIQVTKNIAVGGIFKGVSLMQL